MQINTVREAPGFAVARHIFALKSRTSASFPQSQTLIVVIS